MQVELDSGKRVKVKAAHVLLRFAQPSPSELLSQARTLSDDIDLNLAWEFAPEAEFGFAELASDYFGASGLAEQLASWMGTIHYEVTSRIHPVVPRLAGPEQADGARPG